MERRSKNTAGVSRDGTSDVVGQRRNDGGSTTDWLDYVAVVTEPVRLVRGTTCLVVVDMQYATGSTEHGLGLRLSAERREKDGHYRFGRITNVLIPNLIVLLEACRANDVRVLYLTYGSEAGDYSDLPPVTRGICRKTNNRKGAIEHEIVDAVRPHDGEMVINKTTVSAFASSGIDLLLHTWGIKTLLFSGVATNMCVEHTLRDAADRGFSCVLIEDACAADTEAMHRATLEVIPRLYGEVWTTLDTCDAVSRA